MHAPAGTLRTSCALSGCSARNRLAVSMNMMSGATCAQQLAHHPSAALHQAREAGNSTAAARAQAQQQQSSLLHLRCVLHRHPRPLPNPTAAQQAQRRGRRAAPALHTSRCRQVPTPPAAIEPSRHPLPHLLRELAAARVDVIHHLQQRLPLDLLLPHMRRWVCSTGGGGGSGWLGTPQMNTAAWRPRCANRTQPAASFAAAAAGPAQMCCGTAAPMGSSVAAGTAPSGC